ncbi:MAG: hypothetical protein KC543_09350 [Myxococcales bacterium]|nr:hypothetical protein [Myxococcales bacterium]
MIHLRRSLRVATTALALTGLLLGAPGLLPVAARAAHAQTEAPAPLSPRESAGLRPRESTIETARGVGMGMGVRAGVTGTSALAYNPANLPLARMYRVALLTNYVPSQKTTSIGVAIADSITSKLGASTSFRYVIGNEDRAYDGFDWRLALGLPLTPKFGLGLGVRYLRLNADKNDQDQPLGPHARGITLDAAARVTLFEGLNLAFLAYNLIDLDSPLAPIEIGGSASYAVSSVGLELGVDVLVDMTTFKNPQPLIGAGVQYIAGDHVPLRFGYRRDKGRDLSEVSASIGYIERSYSVALAVRQELHHDTVLQLDLRYHVR